MELTAAAETRAQWNALLEIPEITTIYAGMGCFKREIFEEQAEKGILQAKELGKQVYLMLPHVVREGDLKEYRDTFTRSMSPAFSRAFCSSLFRASCCIFFSACSQVFSPNFVSMLLISKPWPRGPSASFLPATLAHWAIYTGWPGRKV